MAKRILFLVATIFAVGWSINPNTEQENNQLSVESATDTSTSDQYFRGDGKVTANIRGLVTNAGSSLAFYATLALVGEHPSTATVGQYKFTSGTVKSYELGTLKRNQFPVSSQAFNLSWNDATSQIIIGLTCRQGDSTPVECKYDKVYKVWQSRLDATFALAPTDGTSKKLRGTLKCWQNMDLAAQGAKTCSFTGMSADQGTFTGTTKTFVLSTKDNWGIQVSVKWMCSLVTNCQVQTLGRIRKVNGVEVSEEDEQATPSQNSTKNSTSSNVPGQVTMILGEPSIVNVSKTWVSVQSIASNAKNQIIHVELNISYANISKSTNKTAYKFNVTVVKISKWRHKYKATDFSVTPEPFEWRLLINGKVRVNTTFFCNRANTSEGITCANPKSIGVYQPFAKKALKVLQPNNTNANATAGKLPSHINATVLCWLNVTKSQDRFCNVLDAVASDPFLTKGQASFKARVVGVQGAKFDVAFNCSLDRFRRVACIASRPVVAKDKENHKAKAANKTTANGTAAKTVMIFGEPSLIDLTKGWYSVASTAVNAKNQAIKVQLNISYTNVSKTPTNTAFDFNVTVVRASLGKQNAKSFSATPEAFQWTLMLLGKVRVNATLMCQRANATDGISCTAAKSLGVFQPFAREKLSLLQPNGTNTTVGKPPYLNATVLCWLNVTRSQERFCQVVQSVPSDNFLSKGSAKFKSTFKATDGVTYKVAFQCALGDKNKIVCQTGKAVAVKKGKRVAAVVEVTEGSQEKTVG